ncbi:DUF58 domain-containing protein [uncultured Paludibaculum sp.]|uniref:DUF58 domain-containing protein n=1 Tax=uncultured Paludibaculum sp. TaxID=1765020 RepID=UPI002AABA385|nr:DUF58 domain-containing protein [uncultured Paludibaculum sp.]
MTGSLAPPHMQAPAEHRRRLPFAFGHRFFLALLPGLLWLAPAWRWPGAVAGLWVWDALILAAWLYDLLRLPAPGQLRLTRAWDGPLFLGRGTRVTVTLQNTSACAIRVRLVDVVPPGLADDVVKLLLDVGPAGSASSEYGVIGRVRGDLAVGDLFLRYQSPLGLAERWAVAPLAQSVRVLPDLPQARTDALAVAHHKQAEIEQRRRQLRGLGREFETLREYRQGDDLRDICWTATARRHHLVTRTYTAERSQTLWLVVDAGRLSRTLVEQPGTSLRLTKLDYAGNAALTLAVLASQCGDKVGLLAYGRAVQQSIAPGRGPLHLRALVESIAGVRAEALEAQHARAARALLKAQSRRALVVWITDFAETPGTPDVIEHAVQLSSRHLVVFAALSQPDLAAVAARTPQSKEEMYRHAAALEIVQRREVMMRSLRQQGILALDLHPDNLSTSLLNEYLRVKDRSLL